MTGGAAAGRLRPAAWRRAAGLLLATLALSAAGLGAGGCGPPEPADTPELGMEIRLDPSPPRVGDTKLTLRLTQPDGEPLEGARVRVEGNMSHAGMKPSFADLREADAGRYTGVLRFTMGGDWLLLVTARTADGRTAERTIDVPGVNAP